MGEHAAWAGLDDPIYAEKDLEVFRPQPRESTLPVYYVKGYLPVSADTLFNALMDARYRKTWDTLLNHISVVDHKQDGDIMYAASNLPWPLSNRDYVYHRRVKFFPEQHAFVVICQAAHHASAPECNGFVRVETYALRMCIRASSGSNDACDFHAEYEDDTNFSIPNYGVTFLLHTMLPSFMNNLRAACANYMNYIKTLDDNGVQCIPSQVVRLRSEKRRESTAVAPSGNLSDTTPAKRTIRTKSGAGSKKLFRKRGLFLTRKRRNSRVKEGDSDEGDNSTSSEPSLLRSATSPLTSSRSLTRRSMKKSISIDTASMRTASSQRSETTYANLDDDFVIEFRKQKIGLHLETDLFSNRVLVAFCEKDSEADKCSVRIEPGFLVTSVNGVPVTNFKFNEVLGEIKRAPRPLALGFTYADKQVSKKYRRFKEPKNVLKCMVSRDEHNLMRALRPLDEVASVSAVMKQPFVAPVYSKKKLRSQNSGGGSKPSKESSSECVVIPEGYLLYEIDGCYVLDLAFAEIAHLLNRNNAVRAVAFKPALAVEGEQQPQDAAKSALSRHLSDVFKWRAYSFDDTATNSTASSSASMTPPSSNRTNLAAPSIEPVQVQASIPAQNSSLPQPMLPKLSSEQDVKWGDSSPSVCLSDYSNVVVSAKNVSWAWQQVHLLKADERILSAALMIEKLEAFLSTTSATGVECATARTVANAMSEAREFIARIKERRDASAKAITEFNCESDDGWEFGQTYFGVTTYWKPADDGSVWLKMDGIIEGVDVFNTVAVIREMDLWKLWFPFCGQSSVLQQTGHVDYLTYLCISSPVLQRDAVLKAFAINAVYESRCILMLGNTVDESVLPLTIDVPKIRGWNSGRMDINGLRAMIEPISRTKARTCIVANIDPKCAIPKPLLNFGIKKMAGILLFLMRKEAEKIEKAQRDGTMNDHLARIEGDPTQFYTWLRPLVDKFLEDQQCGVLPPRLALTATETLGRAASNSSTLSEQAALVNRSPRNSSPRSVRSRSCSRTAAFHRDANAISTKADLVPKRRCLDYLYDFGIWPYLLLFVFADVTPDMPLLRVCVLKFIFTCTCAWFGVPGAFSWQTRQRKRERNELVPLRQRFVVLAGMLDVVNSWAMRAYVHWIQCYVAVFNGPSNCFDRSPAEIREAENFWLLGSAFVFATAVVGVQIIVNI